MAESVDLSVKFGSQMRIKCPACKKYVAHLGQILCNCGAIWQQVTGTYYVRVK